VAKQGNCRQYKKQVIPVYGSVSPDDRPYLKE